MNATRAQVVAEALSWEGTPYLHQAHLKGIACDCRGLVGGVALALGLVPPDFWRANADAIEAYSRQPSGGRLVATLRRFMPEIEPAAAQAGDVVVMAWASEPQHLAFLVPYFLGGFELLHAVEHPGRVIRQRYAQVLRARVTHAFALPGVA